MEQLWYTIQRQYKAKFCKSKKKILIELPSCPRVLRDVILILININISSNISIKPTLPGQVLPNID